MQEAAFTVNAPGVDVDRLTKEIRETVARKKAAGAYQEPEAVRAERWNLDALRDDDEFIEAYLDSLRDAAVVDINDFEIVERRAAFAPLLRALKRTLWKLLKFYTYRLWSQQNTINGLFLAALENRERRQRRRLAALEARITALEGRRGTPECPPCDA